MRRRGSGGSVDPVSSIELPPDIESIRRARDFVRGKLEEWGLGEMWQPVLVASELAANAVQHARTNFTIRVELTVDDEVRVHVRDGAAAQEVAVGLSERGGQGLRAIEKLAKAWGVDRDDGGKTVWVLLQRGQ